MSTVTGTESVPRLKLVSHNGFVSLKHLAAILGADRSALLKWLKKRRYSTTRHQFPGTRGCLAVAITLPEATRVITDRQAEGYSQASQDALGKAIDGGIGARVISTVYPSIDDAARNQILANVRRGMVVSTAFQLYEFDDT